MSIATQIVVAISRSLQIAPFLISSQFSIFRSAMAERNPGHQHVSADSSVLSLTHLHGKLSPVAYRTSSGDLYWDLGYVFDHLAQHGGETSSSFKLTQLIEKLCEEDDLLSDRDFHSRQRVMRPAI